MSDAVPVTFDWQASAAGDTSWRGASRQWIVTAEPNMGRTLSGTKVQALFWTARDAARADIADTGDGTTMKQTETAGSAGAPSSSDDPGGQTSLGLTSSAADSPARTSAWQDVVRALTEHVRGSGGSSAASCLSSAPVGFLSKTSLAYCPDVAALTAEPLADFSESTHGSERSVKSVSRALHAVPESECVRLIRGAAWPSSFTRWRNSGIWGPGGAWTLNSSVHPRDGSACLSSLSQVLEDRVDPKYFLSPKACRGILRRAEKRGKDLPPSLKSALERRATDTGTETE